MITQKRYLAVIDHPPHQIGKHEEKGSYASLGHAVNRANRLAEQGAKSVLVISQAGVVDLYNAWMSHFKDAWNLHYHVAHESIGGIRGFAVVLPADIKGVLMTL